MRVMSVTPLSLMTLMMPTENRRNSHSTTCTATIAGGDGRSLAGVVDTAHEDDRRDDRARAGEQRRAERDECHVDVGRLGRVVGLAGQQLQRDEQQQQTPGRLHRGQRDAQVVEDRLAEQARTP